MRFPSSRLHSLALSYHYLSITASGDEERLAFRRFSLLQAQLDLVLRIHGSRFLVPELLEE